MRGGGGAISAGQPMLRGLTHNTGEKNSNSDVSMAMWISKGTYLSYTSNSALKVSFRLKETSALVQGSVDVTHVFVLTTYPILMDDASSCWSCA